MIDLDPVREAGLPGLDLGVPVLDTPCSSNTSCILERRFQLSGSGDQQKISLRFANLTGEQIDNTRIMTCSEAAWSKGSGSTIRQGALHVAVGETQGYGAVAVRLLQRAIAKAHGGTATDAVRLLLA